MRQRVAIVVAAVAGGLLLLGAGEAARAADGTAGCTLLYAASPLLATGRILLAAIPVALLGVIVSATGHRLGGVFAVAVALIFPAVDGGSIDQWLRSAESSAAYWLLTLEMLLWGGIIGAMALAALWLGPRLQRLAPWLKARTGEEPEARPAEQQRGGDRSPEKEGGVSDTARSLARTLGWPPQRVQLVGSAFVAAVLGALLTALLVRSPHVWQVVWGVAIAFSLAGLIAHQFLPASNPVGVLLSPIVVGLFWYIAAALTGGAAPDLLSSYFEGRFLHGALALPIFYASAGVAGASFGIGWSWSLLTLAEEERREAAGFDAGAVSDPAPSPQQQRAG